MTVETVHAHFGPDKAVFLMFQVRSGCIVDARGKFVFSEESASFGAVMGCIVESRLEDVMKSRSDGGDSGNRVYRFILPCLLCHAQYSNRVQLLLVHHAYFFLRLILNCQPYVCIPYVQILRMSILNGHLSQELDGIG